MDGFLEQGGIRTDTTGIFGVLVYWLVILAALIIAFNSLGLTYITELLREVVLFVPQVIVALLILAFGDVLRPLRRRRGDHLLPQHRDLRTRICSAGSRSTRSSHSSC